MKSNHRARSVAPGTMYPTTYEYVTGLSLQTLFAANTECEYCGRYDWGERGCRRCGAPRIRFGGSIG